MREWADTAASFRPRVTYSVPVTGDPVLAYGGLSEGLTYVLPFLEQRRGLPSRRYEHHTSWAELTRGSAAPGADILAVGYPGPRVPVVPPSHALLLPFRVSLTVEVGSDPAEVLRRVSRKARQQHNRELRSRARSLEVTAEDADFDGFYDNMHQPTMDRRHGEAARSEPRESARACILRRGRLFFLCESGRRVAGMLCRLEGRTLTVRLAGVDGGDENAYQSGTYMALFIMILQWAAEHRFTRVDLSGGEPFLSKGTFQFKRKMHPEVTLPANHFRDKRLLLRVCRDNDAVRDFLVANPVLAFTENGDLEAVYFHDVDRSPRLDLRWRSPGVERYRLVDLDGFLAGLPAGPVTPPSRWKTVIQTNDFHEGGP
ncbi:GNAT family N-acetyltransferase [Nocardiopsis sp. NPDC049922]|uniref:GNAT family N-acetyltransferase n=1 Tax=Nocardiopsis sp. NPDC049922 TaxID=3155157 RepID=UPI00340FA731